MVFSGENYYVLKASFPHKHKCNCLSWDKTERGVGAWDHTKCGGTGTVVCLQMFPEYFNYTNCQEGLPGRNIVKQLF